MTVLEWFKNSVGMEKFYIEIYTNYILMDKLENTYKGRVENIPYRLLKATIIEWSICDDDISIRVEEQYRL